MRVFKFFGILGIFLLWVEFSFALVISEVQFDPSGSDTDREWVEIFNDTNSVLDLTTYKFFENNTNHAIEWLSGDKNISSGEYVVLVQDLNKFMLDNSGYIGKVFKSSFSLSNSGESLSLKDKDGNVLNTINYSPTQTGAGNGLTINFDGINYTKGNPSPGVGTYVFNSTNQNQNTENNSTTTATTTQSISTTTSGTQNVESFAVPIYYYRSYFPESEKIYVYAGENKTSITGADVFFEGKAVTGDKRNVTDVNFFWSFGDGETAEGKNVKHIYKYSGEYVVDLEGYANGSKSEDRIYVKVIDGDLKISLEDLNGDRKIKIENGNKMQTNIGGYFIATHGGEFDSKLQDS